MIQTNIDLQEAARAFGSSTHAVKKWLSGQRVPRPRTQAKIMKITRGAVTPNDWVAGQAQ